MEIAQRFQLDGIGIGDETVANNHSVDELTPKSQFSPVIEKFENEIMDDTKSFNPWFRGQRRNGEILVVLIEVILEGFDPRVDLNP